MCRNVFPFVQPPLSFSSSIFSPEVEKGALKNDESFSTNFPQVLSWDRMVKRVGGVPGRGGRKTRKWN